MSVPDIDALIERAVARGLSKRALADVLGIHPHLLRSHLLRPGGSVNGLAGQPAGVLIELAHLIEAHPGDIVAGLDAVLGYPRLPREADADQAAGPDAGRDVLTVLAALAAAGNPASVEQLAEALSWPPQRVTDALEHAALHPVVGGALALHRIDATRYAAAPALNLLTAAQREALNAIGPKQPMLSTDELDVFNALIHDDDVPHDGYEAHQRLLNRGLLRTGPGGASVDADVLYSLGAYHKPRLNIWPDDPAPFNGLPPVEWTWREDLPDNLAEELSRADWRALFSDPAVDTSVTDPVDSNLTEPRTKT